MVRIQGVEYFGMAQLKPRARIENLWLDLKITVYYWSPFNLSETEQF